MQPLHHLFRSALVCLTLSACTTLDYVPDTGWSESEDAPDFYEDWFGNQLRAAREPPLKTQDDLKGFTSRFRLLVLPTFDPAIVVRIDETSASNYVLNYTRLDGAGGYEPGKVAEKKSRALSLLESKKISASIKDADFRSATRSVQTLTEVDQNGDEIIVLCADGTTYVLEHLTRDYHSFVSRHSCRIGENPELRKLIETASSMVQ